MQSAAAAHRTALRRFSGGPSFFIRLRFARAKAVSPLRSATVLQDAGALLDSAMPYAGHRIFENTLNN
jgi:hypothetical protein